MYIAYHAALGEGELGEGLFRCTCIKTHSFAQATRFYIIMCRYLCACKIWCVSSDSRGVISSRGSQ